MSLRSILLVLVTGALAACGSSSTGKVPVDNPIYEYYPPEEVAEADVEEEEEEEELADAADDAEETDEDDDADGEE